MSQLTAFAGTITISDVVSNNLALQKVLSGFGFTGTVFTSGESISVGTGGSALGLPVSPVQLVYIKNTHATQTLAITWTPTGGASVAGPTLQPGACVLLVESNLTSGFTAITLTGSSAGTTVEFILAG